MRRVRKGTVLIAPVMIAAAILYGMFVWLPLALAIEFRGVVRRIKRYRRRQAGLKRIDTSWHYQSSPIDGRH